VNPDRPQLAGEGTLPDERVTTFTAPNFRTTSFDPHSGQGGSKPSEYADIEARISNVVPQSSQT
jgi:hypothetical protein